MQRLFKIIFVSSIILSASTANAAKFPTYATLTNIPGVESGTVQTAEPDLSLYLNSLYKMGVAAAAGLAVIMVIWGGIQYITSAGGEGKSSGRERISSAILGLLLALGSYLILQTINPDLLKLSFNLPDSGVNINVTNVNPTQYQGGASNLPISNELITTAEGQSINPGRVAIDTDGISRPPFYDPDYRNSTSLPGLDANVNHYVVVPIGSQIPLGSKVTVINNTTGKRIEAIVGDRGPAANGYGEISLALARDLGAWNPTMGNSVAQHNINYIFHN